MDWECWLSTELAVAYDDDAYYNEALSVLSLSPITSVFLVCI